MRLSRSIEIEQMSTYSAYNNIVKQSFMSVLSFMIVLRHSVFHRRHDLIEFKIVYSYLN